MVVGRTMSRVTVSTVTSEVADARRKLALPQADFVLVTVTNTNRTSLRASICFPAPAEVASA
jgi:hypothetical protein